MHVRTLKIAACAILAVIVPGWAIAQDSLFGPGKGALFQAGPKQPVVSASLEPTQDGAKDELTLKIHVALPAGAYTYSTSESFAARSQIKIQDAVGVTPIGDDFEADRAPKRMFDPNLKTGVEKFYGEVTWSRKYRLQPAASGGQAKIRGVLEYQVCDENQCVPLEHPFEVTYQSDRATASAVGTASTTATPTTTTGSEAAKFHVEHVRMLGGKRGPVILNFGLVPDDAKPGDLVTLSITAKLDPHWHIYSITQPIDNAAEPTEIEITQTSSLEPIGEGFQPDRAPQVTHPLDDITQEVYEGAVTWSRQYKVLGGNGYGIAGNFGYQICDERRCLPLKTVEFLLGSLVSQPGASSETAHVVTTDLVQPSETTSSVVEPSEFELASESAGKPIPQHLFAFLLAAVAAGFASLLTPCVFPMVPITVSFFLKQSEKEHHRPVITALIYCGGIIITFTALGLLMAAFFGATSINELANNGWLNLAIAGVLIFFGMNLLGLFEIRIPGWLLTWTAGKESKGGIIGTLFMALTFTLTSFTCTFAFAGVILVWAADGQYYWPILGMATFAAAFSVPFFFLALFPSFLKSLPTSGGWMNRVKVVMGLIELGAAFKFLSVSDFVWHPTPWFFDFELVMSAWMIISIVGGLYLLGLFRLPHDTASDYVGVGRLMFALGFFGLASYLAVGLFASEKPTGKIWENIASFAPPKFEAGEDEQGPYHEHGGLKYSLDFNRAMEFAQKTQRPVFLDFTGVNCTNCRKMEDGPMSKPYTAELLKKFVRVQLYVDRVPSIRDEELAAQLKSTNQELQKKFGNVGLPTYFLITPDQRPKILGRFEGVELSEGEFADFLDQGLKEWSEQQVHQAETTAKSTLTLTR